MHELRRACRAKSETGVAVMVPQVVERPLTALLALEDHRNPRILTLPADVSTIGRGPINQEFVLPETPGAAYLRADSAAGASLNRAFCVVLPSPQSPAPYRISIETAIIAPPSWPRRWGRRAAWQLFLPM